MLAAAQGCYEQHAEQRFAGGAHAGSAGKTGHKPSGSAGGGSGHGYVDVDAGMVRPRRGAGGVVPERDAGLLPGDAGPPGSFVQSTDPGLRVAFFGDQAIGANAEAVLQLVKREHADVVVHAGDFAYLPNVEAWNAQIDAVLGPDFPYFATIGNHDVGDWAGPSGYQAVLQARLDRIEGAACSGDLGVNAVCKYRGLMFVLSGVGTYGTDDEDFLDAALDDLSVWRLCIWHKNQHDMQVGGKTDEVGWRAYQICQSHGAPIITAHEHSYARSYTLTALGDRAALHGYTGVPEQLVFAPGSTAVVVSGLGGHSFRAWNGESNPWWASIYAANLQQENAVMTGSAPQIEYGALFVDFHVDQDPYKAHAYFKTISNAVIDDFTLHVAH